jgi:hypothetical protein
VSSLGVFISRARQDMRVDTPQGISACTKTHCDEGCRWLTPTLPGFHDVLRAHRLHNVHNLHTRTQKICDAACLDGHACDTQCRHQRRRSLFRSPGREDTEAPGARGSRAIVPTMRQGDGFASSTAFRRLKPRRPLSVGSLRSADAAWARTTPVALSARARAVNLVSWFC